MGRKAEAIRFFNEGNNCAQSVLKAFRDIAGLQEERAAALAAGFGGGISGRRETCGALSALTMIAGILEGNYPVTDNKMKTEFYNKVKKCFSIFEEKFGTSNCRELLQKANCIVKSDPSERTPEYYSKRPCGVFVLEAVQILEQEFNIKD